MQLLQTTNKLLFFTKQTYPTLNLGIRFPPKQKLQKQENLLTYYSENPFRNRSEVYFYPTSLITLQCLGSRSLYK